VTVAHPRSVAFAESLNSFLASALHDDVSLSIVDDGHSVRVGGAGPRALKFTPISLEPSPTSPLLRVEFKLADDMSGDFFRVINSTFGLLAPVDKSGKAADPVPIIRVEFDRTQAPPAHVHFHTSSQTLGWVYGRAGGRYRRSEDLHFPIGSERFRPTIEDFLLFLDQERLFRAWRPNSDWRTQAHARIAEYERRQAVAMVRHHDVVIAEELRRLGWTVQPPTK
jgi:hypothetical protein